MINFIVSNYMIILIVVMIIIFALIGRYVDSIDFFASYKDDSKSKELELQEAIEKMKQKEKEEDIENQDMVFETPETLQQPENEVQVNTTEVHDIDSALFAPIDKDSDYIKFNRELNNMLSKKELIDDDLLSDIEHLSLDKTQRYNFKDIPDLDDVDLPEIKKSEEPEDIWKF